MPKSKKWKIVNKEDKDKIKDSISQEIEQIVKVSDIIKQEAEALKDVMESVDKAQEESKQQIHGKCVIYSIFTSNS